MKLIINLLIVGLVAIVVHLMKVEENQVIYDVVVVGGGLFGSAVIKYVSEDSNQCLMIGPSENAKVETGIYGAWFDEGRIAELADSEDVWNIVGKHSIARFRDIEAKSGIKFFSENGFINVLSKSDSKPQDLDSFDEICNQIVEEGHKCIKLNESYAQEIFPYLKFPPDFVAFYQPDFAGVINPRRLVEAQQKIATDQGCQIIDGHVTNVERYDDGVFGVTTSFSEGIETKLVFARKIVIANGVYVNLNNWMRNLVPDDHQDMKPDLVLARETVAFLEVSETEAARLKNFPNMVTHYPFDIIDGTYILPPIKYPDGKIYLKLGHLDAFETEIPDEGAVEEIASWYQGSGYPEATEILSNFIKLSLVPDIEVKSVHGGSCVVAKTPQMANPYIGYLSEGVILVAGGNGYGANGSDEIGRIGAKLATRDEWTSDIPQERLAVQWKS